MTYPENRHISTKSPHDPPHVSTQSGRKDDGGKPPLAMILALLPPGPLLEITKAFEYGLVEYGYENWKQCFPWMRISNALVRHFWAWITGETIDEKSNCHHLACVCSNAIFLLYMYLEGREDLDDRPVTKWKELQQ